MLSLAGGLVAEAYTRPEKLVSRSHEFVDGAPSHGGLVENLIEVLYAPSKVFDRTRTTKAFLYALVTAVIVGAIMFATKNLLQPWLDAQGDLAIKMAAAKGRPMPEQAISGMRTMTSWGIIIGAPIVMLVGPYLNAVLIVLGAKVMKAPITYGQAAMVAVLSGVPRVIGTLLMPVQGVLLDGSNARSLADFSLGPARFLDPLTMSPAVLTLISNLDLFRLWQIALVAIGVAIVARVPKSTGAVVAVLMFAISAILQMLPTLLG